MSGPTRRPVPAPVPRGRTGPFERLARVPDHRVVDRLLRSRACIWLIGLMLGGIVFMQVSLLRMNTGISRAVATQETFERQNAALQAQIAGLSSAESIREKAAAGGMVDPPAGDNRYLQVRPSKDARYAARRMRPESTEARLVMENGGMLPNPVAATTGTIPALTAPPVTATDPATGAALAPGQG